MKRKQVWSRLVATALAAGLFGGTVCAQVVMVGEESDGGFSGTVRSSIGHNWVGGDGFATSFLDEGTVWNSDMDIRYDDRFELFDQPLRLGIDSSLRYANDTSIDPEHKVKVMKFALTLALDDPEVVRELTLGDFYANLSQYTFSQSAKGAILNSTFGNNRQFETILFAGKIKPNWDDFFREHRGEAQTRMVTGARFAHKVTRDLTYGLNVAYLRDDDTSGDTSTGFVMDDRNTVYSVDLRYRPVRWYRFDGEVAYSRYDTPGDRVRSDWALRLKNYFMIERARIYANYERVGTYFTSLGGAAAADREQYYAKATTPIGERLNLDVSYRYYRNDLSHDGPSGTTRVHNPELRLEFTPLLDRRTLRAYFDYKDRFSDNDDDAGKIDNITRTLALGVMDQIGQADVNVSVERRFFWDDVTNNLDTESWRLNGHVGYRINIGETTDIYPYLDATGYRQNYTDTSQKSYNVILGGGVRCNVGQAWALSASYQHDDFDDSTPGQTIDSERGTARATGAYRFGSDYQHEVSLNYREMRFDHEQRPSDYYEKQLWLECLIAF